MRTITIEEHFLSAAYQEVMHNNAAGQGSASNAATPLEEKLADLGATRLQAMDAGGIDFQVISHTASGTATASGTEDSAKSIRLTQAANDQLAAAVAAHPDRFAGFALLPMSEPRVAADELERAVRSLKFKGAMINGTTNGLFLDDAAFLPLLERAATLDVPLYLHPAEPPAVVREAYYAGFEPAVGFNLATSGWGWHSETAIHALRLILAGVFDRFPSLQIIIGHMGEMIPFMLARINDRLTPVAKHLQRTVPEYFLQNFYVTTSGFFTDPPLLLTMQAMGAERIIFSVDYPYSTNEQGRLFLDHVAISPADKEKISHLNAERLLKLE